MEVRWLTAVVPLSTKHIVTGPVWCRFGRWVLGIVSWKFRPGTGVCDKVRKLALRFRDDCSRRCPKTMKFKVRKNSHLVYMLFCTPITTVESASPRFAGVAVPRPNPAPFLQKHRRSHSANTALRWRDARSFVALLLTSEVIIARAASALCPAELESRHFLGLRRIYCVAGSPVVVFPKRARCSAKSWTFSKVFIHNFEVGFFYDCELRTWVLRSIL